MRVCVVGAGLAGSLLAWRLVRRPGVRVTLAGTGGRDAGATAASGGLVRGFESDPHNAALAIRGIVELTASATLTRWARPRLTGSVYVCRAPAPRTLSAIDAALPGSLCLASAVELATRYGFSGIPAGSTGVVERIAGYLSPGNLARMAVEDVMACGGVVFADPVHRWRVAADGSVHYDVGAESGIADVFVLATGAWTAQLLRLGGLAKHRLRTKLIQYGVYQADGPAPPAFVEESAGLYGRSAGPGRILLGLPTTEWGRPPGDGRFLRELERAVRQQAAVLLPRLSIGALIQRVAAVDSYSSDARLALRPVAPSIPVYTFAGGSGGAAKTALAASADAVDELLDRCQPGTSATPNTVGKGSRHDRCATPHP